MSSYQFLNHMAVHQLLSFSKDGRYVWPRFRGKRAGHRARERVNRCRYSIEVHQTSRVNRSRSSRRYRNKANCVSIPRSQQQDQRGSRKVYVPSVLKSNVMSLAPKLDDVAEAIINANLDIACITGIWLRDYIDDNVVSIPGYNLVRRDRMDIPHGGVCTYIKKGLNYTVLYDLYDDKIEAIWLQLRPSRLPRGISCIIVDNVYHPQTDKGVSDSEILDYLYNSMSTIESRFLNSGVLTTGDFNRLDTSRFKNAFKLKQIVKFPTRGNQTLDLVLTNIKEFYEKPIKRPAFGFSDHVTVELQPLSRCKTQPSKRTIITRDQRESYRVALSIYLENVNINDLVKSRRTLMIHRLPKQYTRVNQVECK